MLNCLIKRNHNLAVVFLDETTTDDEVLLAELENIDGETKKYDIDFVKVCSHALSSRQRPLITMTIYDDEITQVEDNEEAADYGITLLPALVYFENQIPSLYDDDLAKV